jgi:multiple sugar transport system permease protein
MWLFSTSLRLPAQSFERPLAFFPTEFRWQNYRAVFESPLINYPLFFINSLKIAVVVVAGQLLTCSIAAFAFARLRFRGKTAVFFLFLASMMVPSTVVIIPYFITVRYLGLADTHWALILPGLSSAFGVFLMRQHFMSLPYELVDAGKIDGASFFRIYWNILLPMIAPALASQAIFTFLSTWNDFYNANLFLRTFDKFTLPIALVLLQDYMGSGSISEIMAAIFLSMVPALIVFLVAQDYVIESMARSGMKG